ncbi:MAG TPA: hypothetical protein VJ623_00495 [Holophagaceae bacterium]|nr:hypothetical protein [Holophagaceae bacterium]
MRIASLGWIPMIGLPLLAQCSDAGVCALERTPSGPGNQLSLAGQYGRSGEPDDLSFRTLRLQGRFRLGERTSFSLMLPFGRVEGPLGATSGLGDAIVVVDRALVEGAQGRLTGQVGARLPTGRDDAAGLPQRYQLGLGATDFLLGLRWEGLTWEAGLGYQKAGARSGNPVDPLKRGDDLLLHLGARHRLGPFDAHVAIVAIRRLSPSDEREPDGTLRTLPESDRLQINVTGALTLPLDRRWSLESRLALPLLKRPDNTDGLKRALTMELGATYRF